MTRISIEDFPIDDAVLYLIEPAFSNCPPETIKYDGTMRGTPSYSGGSIDTITNITFTHDRKIIHPIQLHWNIGERNYISPRDFPVKRTKDGTNNIVSCNNADTLDAIISIEEKGSNVTYDAYYETDYRKLCQRMMHIVFLNINKCRYDNKFFSSLLYLVAFDNNAQLPDKGCINFKNNRKIEIEWNDTIKKCLLKGNIHHYRPHADYY